VKQLKFIPVLFFAVCFSNITIAQPTEPAKFHLIELDADAPCFAKTIRIDVAVDDTIQFKTINGDFAIYIINAADFLPIKEQNLGFVINSADDVSDSYVVREPINDQVFYCSIFCISTLSWPDAPPRIIVMSK